MWQKGRQTWIRTTAYSRIQAKKQGSVQFSRLAFRMDFKGGENPFLMAREGHRKPPRHPSVRNIAKSGKRAFYGVFRPEKRKHRTSLGKSTDVCPQKYGCFALRSPMFLKSKRPDFELFSSKTRVFQRKSNLSLPFSENQNTTN